MKLLLDQNMSAGVADILRERGFDVVLTHDADFHAILAVSAARGPSVVRIRIEGLADHEMAHLVERVLDATRADLLRGAAVSVSVTSIRVRSLPLLASIE